MTDFLMKKGHDPKEAESLALYHRVLEKEGFEVTAKILWKLVQDAQKKSPQAKLHLYWDVEGHRNEAGGLDWDMFALIQQFLFPVLSRYLTSFSTPINPDKRYGRETPQEEIPMHEIEFEAVNGPVSDEERFVTKQVEHEEYEKLQRKNEALIDKALKAGTQDWIDKMRKHQ